MDIFAKVRELLAAQLKIEDSKITMESDFISDLEADSVDIFEMLVTMEEMFDITMPDELVSKIKTVGDLVSFIESLA